MVRGRGRGGRGRPRGGGRYSMAAGERPVDEATRIALQAQVEAFQASAEQSLTLPAMLSNHDRAVVHTLCRKLGLTSKSDGYGQDRRLTIYKPVVVAKETPLLAFPLDGRTRRELRQHMMTWPMSAMERDLVLSPAGRCSSILPLLPEALQQGDKEAPVTVKRSAPWRHAPSLDAIKQEHSRWEAFIQSPEATDALVTRSSLPIAAHRSEIIDSVAENQVVLIAGDTGCGKTTQVPQYILEDATTRGSKACILCSQPRRISAVSVAARVAAERGDEVGGTVGYKIRLDAVVAKRTALTFLTNGVLLKMLSGADGSKEEDVLKGVTHVIMDEVHERDRFSDFALIMMRELLRRRPGLRLILMSATMQIDKFSAYFGGCPVLQVPGRTFPVQEYFLEDILRLTGMQEKMLAKQANARKSAAPMDPEEESVVRAAINDARNLKTEDAFFHMLLCAQSHSPTTVSAAAVAASPSPDADRAPAGRASDAVTATHAPPLRSAAQPAANGTAGGTQHAASARIFPEASVVNVSDAETGGRGPASGAAVSEETDVVVGTGGDAQNGDGAVQAVGTKSVDVAVSVAVGAADDGAAGRPGPGADEAAPVPAAGAGNGAGTAGTQPPEAPQPAHTSAAATHASSGMTAPAALQAADASGHAGDACDETTQAPGNTSPIQPAQQVAATVIPYTDAPSPPFPMPASAAPAGRRPSPAGAPAADADTDAAEAPAPGPARNPGYIDVADETGATALMVAAGRGRLQEVCTLLAHGANHLAQDEDGLAAEDWALEYGHQHTGAVLRQHAIAEAQMKLLSQEASALSEYHSKVDVDRVDMNLVVDLLKYICGESSGRPGQDEAPAIDGAILIFLPGWSDISQLKAKLSAPSSAFSSTAYQILPLHSQVDPAQQRLVFKRPPLGVRKIILSTNIAETAVTIDDVVCVINSGRLKEKSFDPYKGVGTLQAQWNSKASEKQRQGRAGRTGPGLAFHLYSKTRSNELEPFQQPELKRCSLEEVALHIKLMDRDQNVAAYLQQAMDPPVADAVEAAVLVLENIGAFDPGENLTSLGWQLASLPLPPLLGKMVLYGIMFDCLNPVLTVACAQSYRDPWINPTDSAGRARLSTFKASFSDTLGTTSDHVLLVHLFHVWAGKHPSAQRTFAGNSFLSNSTLEMIGGMRRQLMMQLRALGLVDYSEKDLVPWSPKQAGVLLSVLACGLYPLTGMAMSDNNGVRILTRKAEKIRVSAASINCGLVIPPVRVQSLTVGCMMAYEEVTRGETGMLTVRASSIVSWLPVALVAGTLAVTVPGGRDGGAGGGGPAGAAAGGGQPEGDEGDDEDDEEDYPGGGGRRGGRRRQVVRYATMVVDGWLRFQLPDELALQVACLRLRLQAAFATCAMGDKAMLTPALSEALTTIASMFFLEATSKPLSGGVPQAPRMPQAVAVLGQRPSARWERLRYHQLYGRRGGHRARGGRIVARHEPGSGGFGDTFPDWGRGRGRGRGGAFWDADADGGGAARGRGRGRGRARGRAARAFEWGLQVARGGGRPFGRGGFVYQSDEDEDGNGGGNDAVAAVELEWDVDNDDGQLIQGGADAEGEGLAGPAPDWGAEAEAAFAPPGRGLARGRGRAHWAELMDYENEAPEALLGRGFARFGGRGRGRGRRPPLD